MGEIKAIETFYKGYRFRSRLEARWAVFFDACNANWEYEPEGFDLGDQLYYLPDFILYGVNSRLRNIDYLWVEVKGTMAPENEKKIIKFSEKNPIYVVGNIPKGPTFAELINNMGNEAYEGKVPLYNFMHVDGDYYGAFLCVTKDRGLQLLGDDCNYLDEADEQATERAYNMARQKRFEFTEQDLTPLEHEVEVLERKAELMARKEELLRLTNGGK